MPFPLPSVPYGLRQRLLELSTPFEAFKLQTAAPDFAGFQPFVKLIKKEHIDEPDNHSNSITVFDFDAIHIATDVFFFNRKTNFDFVCNHVLLAEIPRTYFEVFHFDQASVTKLCANLAFRYPERKIRMLNLNNCTLDQSITPSVIYKSILKYYNCVSWNPCPNTPNWIEELLESKVGGLVKLDLVFTSVDLLNFDVQSLKKFVLAQHERFVFLIELFLPENINSKEIMQPKINDMFKYFKSVNATEKPKRYVHFSIGWKIDPATLEVRHYGWKFVLNEDAVPQS